MSIKNIKVFNNLFIRKFKIINDFHGHLQLFKKSNKLQKIYLINILVRLKSKIKTDNK
jgi:hypothetical protein